MRHPRHTGDIDFRVLPMSANFTLLAALHDFGFGSLGLKLEDLDLGIAVQLAFP